MIRSSILGNFFFWRPDANTACDVMFSIFVTQDNDVNYYDPGVYSCELEFNGQSAFVIHQSLCVASRIKL